jgi:NAD(P) transhydrogenase subunit beta
LFDWSNVFPFFHVSFLFFVFLFLEVWKSSQVFIFKRGQGRGYSGIENPLFFKENSRMVYGDAKKSLDEILQKIN